VAKMQITRRSHTGENTFSKHLYSLSLSLMNQ